MNTIFHFGLIRVQVSSNSNFWFDGKSSSGLVKVQRQLLDLLATDCDSNVKEIKYLGTRKAFPGKLQGIL